MTQTFRTSGSTGTAKTFDADMAARIANLANERPPGFMDINSIAIAMSGTSTSVARYRQWMESKGGKFIMLGGDLGQISDMVLAEKPECIVGGSGFLAALATKVERIYEPKFVFCSGGYLSPERSVILRLGFGDSVWSNYACAEVGTISFASAAQVEAIRGCVGKPCPGVQVQIVGGLVQVKTPGMIKVYADGTKIGDWFSTGDKGSLASDGSIILNWS